MDILTNREWAILIWMIAIVGLINLNKNVRNAFSGLLKSLINKHFVWLAAYLAAYTIFCIALFYAFGLWAFDQTKTSIVWLFFAAPIACMRATTADQQPQLFKDWVQDTFKLTVIIEFVAFDNSLPLVWELIIIPVVTFFGLLLAAAELKEEHAPVAKFLSAILVLIGLAILLHGLWVIFQNLDSYASLSTVRDIYTVPLLSLSLIPFVYALHIFARYQVTFSPLKIYIPDPELRDYARAKAMIAFGKHTHLLSRWKRQIGTRKPTSRKEVDALIGEILRGYARERKPDVVDPAFGWCPVQAGKFLAPFRLATGDYHELYGDWFSASPYQEINDGLPRDNLAYYVEGNGVAATLLKLVLNVNTQTAPRESEGYFAQIASALINKATGEVIDVQSCLDEGQLGIEYIVGDATMMIEKEPFRNQRDGGYSLRLLVRRGQAKSLRDL